jgi:protein-tyrosine phosphatase
MAGLVDVHSHVVPAGDDGAATIDEGLVLCRLAYEAGTEILFATPHAHAPWDHYPRTIERDRLFAESFVEMRAEVATWGLDLRRGWEVFPSEVAVSPPGDLVLEGTRSVLIEFPGSWLDIEDPIEIVVEAAQRAEAAGLVPVLAHPERCRAVADDPERARPLAERGWILCLNAPSLVGGHGAAAERTAWELLDAGLVTLVASDGHSVARPPTLDMAHRYVREQRGEEIARPLFDGRGLPWI